MIIKLSDYINNAENNVTPSLRRAIDALSDGDTLELGGGVYDLYADGAEVRHYFISNNDPGDKPIAFPLVGSVRQVSIFISVVLPAPFTPRSPKSEFSSISSETSLRA